MKRAAYWALIALACPSVGHAGEASVDREAQSPEGVVVGLVGGALVPRGDLGVGALVGLRAEAPIGDSALRVHTGVDWVRLQQQDSALVSPGNFPRARAELLQDSHLFSGYVGASYGLVRSARLRVYVGASLGLTVNRSRFEALGTTVPKNDVAPLGELCVGTAGPVSGLHWRVELGWRELQSDLGDAGAFGEDTMSGLAIQAGFALQP